MLQLEVEVQPVPQEATISHRKPIRSAKGVKRRHHQEGTEPNKGTVRDRNQGVQPTFREALTGTLEHRDRHSTDYLVLERRNTRGKVLGKEHRGEDGQAKELAPWEESPEGPFNSKTWCGSLGWPSVS